MLGTGAYMSPEQARGRPVDKRTDIWAFGCVLYEVLTRRRAFPGETTSDCIAAVLTREPDWDAVPATVPPGVQSLLRRCLQKDAQRRLRDIGDARIELEEIQTGRSAPSVTAAQTQVTPERRFRLLGGAAVAFVLGALAMALVSRSFRGEQAVFRRVTRFSLTLQNALINPSRSPNLAISPDGSRLAFAAAAQPGGRGGIFIRAFNQDEAKLLSGASGGVPFFSPDGQWLAFYHPVTQSAFEKCRHAANLRTMSRIMAM